ncbi:hypothetical protein Ae201684P_000825 [Aphanomyces euteiches]|nr:hypothetical protein Ae201684P_000825 [Aphanomyces euteiches]
MTKKRMTLHEKNLLRMKWKSQPHSTYAELGVWAAHEFKLLNPPTKSAICKILKKQDVERNDVKTKKNDSSVRFPTIENELSCWVLTCEAKGVSITGDLIKQQAETFCNVHEIPVQSRLVFSNGWLEKFQKRHGFTSKIQHGEARSACKDAVDNGRKAMLDLTVGYNRRDVFNMDETAYFYALAPHRSITRNRLPGLKKSKKRITIALTTNTTCSCNYRRKLRNCPFECNTVAAERHIYVDQTVSAFFKSDDATLRRREPHILQSKISRRRGSFILATRIEQR